MLIGFMQQAIVGVDTNQLIDGVVQTDPLLGRILFTLMAGSSFGFYLWFWTHSGQTLGMIAWNIKLVTMDNHLIGPRQAAIRFIVAWPAFFLFGLGYLWLYIDSEGDTIHDKISATKVLLLPKSHRPF